MSHNGLGLKEHGPLSGVVICWTAVSQESRSHMSVIASQMGARTNLDLTSDVTHLIVGDVNTPKYKYVAKERQDIMVLRESWIEAVRDAWIEGDDHVDVHALERQHQLPTFFGLHICVTGFDDYQERAGLMDCFVAHGAEYHGDLTRSISHLVAASPSGAKYAYAGKWNIKVVSIEWVHASLQRGMVLEETLYHPTTPPDERGIGAVSERSLPSPMSAKRKRPDARQAQAVDDGRRKLRRIASVRLGSQTENVWDQIRRPDDVSAHLEPDEQETIKSAAPGPDSGDQLSQTLPFNSSPNHFLAGHAFFIHSFDDRKTSILQNHIVPRGGVMISTLDSQVSRSGAVIIVPHNAVPQVRDDLVEQEIVIKDDVWVTECWLEKCLHSKAFISPNSHPLYEPFMPSSIPAFSNLVICPTSFSGVDLLHFSKLVKLIGAKYDEALRQHTSVLVCNQESPVNAEKLRFALEHTIPIVSQIWVWDCVASQSLLPFTQYTISGSLQSQSLTQLTFYHPTTNPRPRPAEPKPSRSTKDTFRSSKPQRPRTRQLDLSFGAKPEPSRSPFLEDDDCEGVPGELFLTSARALQDLPSARTNSPQKQDSRSPAKQMRNPIEGDESLAEGCGEHESNITEETLLRPKGLAFHEPPTVSTEPTLIRAESFSLNTAVTALLAHQQKANSSRPSSASSALDSKHGAGPERKHRPLGRAPSNGSAELLSRRDSGKLTNHLEDGFHPDDCSNVYAPSQALHYDDPEGAALRVQLMRKGKGMNCGGNDTSDFSAGALDGAWDAVDRTLKRVEGIGRVTDSGAKTAEEKGRKRGLRKR